MYVNPCKVSVAEETCFYASLKLLIYAINNDFHIFIFEDIKLDII